MNTEQKTDVGCTLVAEFNEDVGAVKDATCSHGNNVQTNMVAEFVEFTKLRDTERVFKIKLRDGTLVSVRGHGLTHVDGASGSSYGVIARSQYKDPLMVALFPASEVAGVFCGDILPT